MLPKLFLGSSSEAKGIAFNIKGESKDVCETTPWYEGVFRPGDYPLERLLDITSTFDFALFLVTADDTTMIRGQTLLVARDNVIFEAGIFLKALGRSRTVLATPKIDLHLPSDLAGLTRIIYPPPEPRPSTTDLELIAHFIAMQMRDVIEEQSKGADRRFDLLFDVLSGGHIYLLRHLAHRDIGFDYAIKILMNFNEESGTPRTIAWEKAAQYAGTTLAALGLIKTRHGWTITELGRMVIEHERIRNRFDREFNIPLI